MMKTKNNINNLSEQDLPEKVKIEKPDIEVVEKEV
jgi:hypothetical protein